MSDPLEVVVVIRTRIPIPDQFSISIIIVE